MINFGNYANENKTEHNLKWPYIPDHPYRILIIGGSGSEKVNVLLHCKRSVCSKNQFLINKRESTGSTHFDDPKTFNEYSNDMQNFSKNIEEQNLGKKRNILIVFYDMIAGMINNKTPNLVVTELFIRDRKLNISIVFITQSYFKVLKYVRLNFTHFFIMKIPNNRELQQTA